MKKPAPMLFEPTEQSEGNTVSNYRIEKDSMGEVRVEAERLWGAQTQRAVDNFSISALRLARPMIHALGLIKRMAAQVNHGLGALDDKRAQAIGQAASEVMQGQWDAHFPVDIFQTGSGTSSNMNANEVIANRANEILGASRGQNQPVHPNDHVNLGQSSNDVIPTAIHIAARHALDPLLGACDSLAQALDHKAQEFEQVIKIGRTHLQDAVPMTLGQEFSGFAQQIKNGIRRLRACLTSVEELALGGTAIGTGLNAQQGFAAQVVALINQNTGHAYTEAPNRFEALAGRDAMVELMGAINTLAVSLMKIGNDIRLLSSGPRTGLGEISLPSLQPGSSIMPGKVNPVLAETLIQVAAQVMGCHLTVTIGAQNAPLQLNVMMPVIAHNVLFSMSILTHAIQAFGEKCVVGIQADKDKCRAYVEMSMALVTPLTRSIGYEKAAQVAYQASRENKTVRQVLIEEKILTEQQAQEILDARSMLHSK